jgi:hypothetical protein
MIAPLNGLWRPEEHPTSEGDWLVARYTADLGKPVREVHTSATDAKRPLVFPTERAAQTFADTLNPPPASDPAGELSEADLTWLQRLADAPEGRMEGSQTRSLLSLEHKGLAASRAEPGRRAMDRWTITEEGRQRLADAKEGASG